MQNKDYISKAKIYKIGIYEVEQSSLKLSLKTHFINVNEVIVGGCSDNHKLLQ